MKENFYYWLRVVALVSFIVAAWAFGLNQLSSTFDNAHALSVRNAEAECIKFDAPHVIVTDDGIYCYVTLRGTELIAPLERLQKLKK